MGLDLDKFYVRNPYSVARLAENQQSPIGGEGLRFTLFRIEEVKNIQNQQESAELSDA